MIKNLMYSLVQAQTLIVWLHFLIHCSNNRFFKPYCRGTQNWTFRISGAEFQRQGHTGGRISLFLHTGRVLHHRNPKIWFFFQKSLKFEFWFLTKSWNHLSFVNISPTLVIDASMEWSSWVLHHGNPKIIFFFKKLEIDEIEFCPYPEFPYAEKRNRPGFVNTSPT